MNAQILNILSQVSALSMEDQLELNKALVENIRRARKISAIQIGQKFNIGDKVMFDAGRKGLITMQITGFSRDGSKIKGPQIGGLRSGVNWTVGNTVTSLRKI
jgi:hypothetical protein